MNKYSRNTKVDIFAHFCSSLFRFYLLYTTSSLCFSIISVILKVDFRHWLVRHDYFIFQKMEHSLKRFSSFRLRRSSVLLKVWSLDQQSRYHLVTYWKYKCSGATSNLLNQTVDESQQPVCLTSLPDVSEAYSSLRTTVIAQ